MAKQTGEKTIAENRRARYDYQLLERFEARWKTLDMERRRMLAESIARVEPESLRLIRGLWPTSSAGQRPTTPTTSRLRGSLAVSSLRLTRACVAGRLGSGS